MKKIIIIGLLFAFACGMAIAQVDNEGDGQQFIHVQLGAGIRYEQAPNDPFSIFNFRAGITGDLLFSLGFIEIGAEIGAYGMEVDWDSYYSYLFLEIPLDILVRVNFDDKRFFALEIRGGGWYMMEISEWFGDAFTFNAGARLVLGSFYIGGDYIFPITNIPLWSVEAGIQISF